MPADRHLQWTLAAVFAVALSFPVVAFDEQTTVQKLIERGALSEAVERANEDSGNPEITYLAALALIKMENRDGANERYGKLREDGDEAWKAIGESGAELLAGNAAAAVEAATRAVEANGDNPYAHYQLGQAASRQNNFARAGQAFERSVELKPDFAYGHYYAGMAFQRARQMAKASEHLNHFIKIAPDSPEKAAVIAILRTLR